MDARIEGAKNRSEVIMWNLLPGETEKKFSCVQGWRDIAKFIRVLEANGQKQKAEARRVA